MGRRTDTRRKGQTSSYNRAMYRNLVTDLLGYEKIITTESKAERIRGLAEEMITLGKKGDLHHRRQALAVIFDKDVTSKVFSELAERYANRTGGYTRLIKLGARLGDAAPMVQIELVK
ncbi:MAG: 50S ribosomal protein L17 [Dehalococcoidales bacterium]|nr:50S ribosomal protein L17 [Dehalococcoidales bacterium]